MEPAGHTTLATRGGGRGTSLCWIVLVGVLASASLATGEVTVYRRDSVATSRRHDPSDTVRTIRANPVRRTEDHDARIATPARSEEERSRASRYRYPGPRVVRVHGEDRAGKRSHPQPIATRPAPVRTILAGRDESAAKGRSFAARPSDSHEIHGARHAEPVYTHGNSSISRSRRSLGDGERGRPVTYVVRHHAYPRYRHHYGRICGGHYGHHRYRRSHYGHRGRYHGGHHGGSGFHIYIRF